jgi:hypothetical protein
MRDIRARERGEHTRFGLPHHGIWMVGALTGFATFPVLWVQTQWVINLGLSYELYVMGIANLVGVALSTLNTQVIRWVERDLTLAEQQRLQDLVAKTPGA